MYVCMPEYPPTPPSNSTLILIRPLDQNPKPYGSLNPKP